MEDSEFPSTLQECKKWFELRGLRRSFSNKSEMLEYAKRLMWASRIPWRYDQRIILRTFQSSGWKELVIQAIFGGGKTTMMLALVFDLLLRRRCDQSQLFVCAFNCAIKNEIKKKTKILGKIDIRTYDSLIYQICSELQFPDLKALNFQTKRKFVIEHQDQLLPNPHIRYVFIDEAQDLEISCYDILRTRFPCAQFMFIGDNFQSIQKEPRESMLWFLLRPPCPLTRKIFKMNDTPRVPEPILYEIKEALQHYYPEFNEDIKEWKSSNPSSHGSSIEWKTFHQYSVLYKEVIELLQTRFPPSETMILTFSSAVTVRGTLGDVARFRRMFRKHGIDVNSNHKCMKEGSLFLTTSNSSKGLERRYVIALLTFPLEMAFSNFSNDLVMNLITVALSRTKESILFFVPTYIDRFSKVLHFFPNCPKPSQCMEAPLLFRKSSPFCYDSSNPIEMLEKEHSVTELLRQSILSFELRTKLLSYVRHCESFLFQETTTKSSIFSGKIGSTEEECAFIGILFETLLLTSWSNQWVSFSLENLKMHDIFQGHRNVLERISNHYQSYQHQHPRCSETEEVRFYGSCLYAQLHLFAYHKIMMEDLNLYQPFFAFWISKRSEFLQSYRCSSSLSLSNHIKTQQNISMPMINGVIDAVVEQPSEFDILEIKASRSPQWKTNALLQAILYGILSAKSVFRIHLLNVFAKKSLTYSIFLQKDLKSLRLQLLQEILNWNLNCYLSKNRKNDISLAHRCLLHGHQDPITHEWIEISCLYFLSDTKSQLHIWTHETTTSLLSQLESTLSTYQSYYSLQAIYHCPDCPSLPSSIHSTCLPLPSFAQLLSHYSSPSTFDPYPSYFQLALYATTFYDSSFPTFLKNR